jgi:hypothetical protein
MLSGLREQLEAEMRAHTHRSVQLAVEDARRQADHEIAQLRETARQEAEDARTSAEAQIADLRRLLEDIRRSTQQQIDEARTTLDSGIAAARARAESEVEDARRLAQSQVEDVQRASDLRIFELMQELTASREQAARSARLLDGIRAMDQAPSLAEVLERMAQAAGREVDRAALLIVKRDLLYAWRLIGFELNGDSTERMDVPVDDSGLLGTAVRERRVVVRPRHDHPGLELPSFAPATPSKAAAAFPVTVAREVVAVLYADAPEAGDGGTPEWCHRMETLTRSASRLLEALTVELSMGLSPLLVQPSHGAPGRQLSEGAQ